MPQFMKKTGWKVFGAIACILLLAAGLIAIALLMDCC